MTERNNTISRRDFCLYASSSSIFIPTSAFSLDIRAIIPIVRIVGKATVDYAPKILDFIANVIQIGEYGYKISTNDPRQNALIMKEIKDKILIIDSNIRDIQKNLISIGIKLDQFKQDDLYITAHSLQSRLYQFNNTYKNLIDSDSIIDKESLYSDFNDLRLRLEDLITKTSPTIEISSSNSKYLPLIITIIANSSKNLIAYASIFYSGKILNERKSAIRSYISGLHDRSADLVKEGSSYDISVKNALDMYYSEIGKISSERNEFRQFANLTESFCVETWNATSKRIHEVDKFFPLNHYQRRDRETGQLRPRVYTSGYVHLRKYDARITPSYIVIDGVKIHTGIGSVTLSQPEINGTLTSGCEVPLENRDAPTWIDEARLQYNSRLETLEPYAKNLAAALSERALMRSAIASLYETKTSI